MCRIILILYHEGRFVYYKAKAYMTTGIAGSIFTIKKDEKYYYIFHPNLIFKFSSLTVPPNSIISFSDELINKVKKEGKNISIRLTCSYPEIIKIYSLFYFQSSKGCRF